MRIEVKFMGQISCEIHETKAEKLRGQIQFHKPNLGMREREIYIYIIGFLTVGGYHTQTSETSWRYII